ncbi:MAG: hypothetical protein CSA81_12535 [Acidobacteria bacterium]|nr:MAG: hypothetical protein CSA81_12535 [Acidobacteriota bacterium]
MDLSRFVFFDFGTSKGNSFEFAKSMFYAKRGLGIDKNPEKVQLMKEKGYDCIQADLTQLDLPENSSSFTIISHCLEHLPDLDAVKCVLRSAKHVSRDFIFIQGPFLLKQVKEEVHCGYTGVKFGRKIQWPYFT